jgi:hypothetical protein
MKREIPKKGGAMNKKHPGRLLLDIAIALALALPLTVFYGLAARLAWSFIFWIYFAVLGAASIGYTIYNRGSWSTRVSRNDLPADWPDEKKDEVLADIAHRRRRSRPLLYLIAALSLVFFYDIFALFLYDPLAKIFPFIWGLI